MKPTIFVFVTVFLMLFVTPSIATDQDKAAVFKCLNDWINDPELDGSVNAWRERLVNEADEHYRTASCFRQKVIIHDRTAAVELAREFDSWGLFNTGANTSILLRMVDTLIRFPEAGQLEDFLKAQAVEIGEVHNEWRNEDAVLAEDVIAARGNVLHFDAETGQFPNEHHKLMQELTANSGLKKAIFSEEAPKDYSNRDEKYLLTANINGKFYEVQAEHFGDWYDYSTVIKFLNKIALDQGLDEKYVMLHTGDQTVLVWITKPQALAHLLNEDLIRLSIENEALEEGKSFEESMIELLK